MCYEERFFSEWAAKRAQRREETKPVKKPTSPSAEPLHPTPRAPKKKEREPELV